MKKNLWRARFGLFLFGCLLTVALLGAGEVLCRYFTRVNFLGNSRGMFTAARFRTSHGNTPNFHGQSFGGEFDTDADGFRFNPQFQITAAPNASAILIVSDSVGFGPAAAEEKTFAGILRRRLTANKIYNASVIGFDTFDYRNLVETVLPQKPDVKTVLLFYCLNDVSDVSAQQIKQQTAQEINEDATDNTPLRPVNDFLRSRSKLYLLLKNLLRDTSQTYFKNDLSYYQHGADAIEPGLQPLVEIKKELDAKNVELKVFVLPYEAQVRSNAPADFLLPQQIVDRFLEKNNIAHVDLTATFQHQEQPSKLFLYGDPMHLSEAGHQLTANLICTNLAGQCQSQ